MTHECGRGGAPRTCTVNVARYAEAEKHEGQKTEDDVLARMLHGL